MTTHELKERADVWASLEASILEDLERVGSSALDAFDLSQYHLVLAPLEKAVMTSPEPKKVAAYPVVAVRRAIRDSRFRPTYSQVQEFVSDALGLSPTAHLEGRDAKARQVVKARPLTLAPHPDNPARLGLKAKMEALKKDRQINGDWPTSRTEECYS